MQGDTPRARFATRVFRPYNDPDRLLADARRACDLRERVTSLRGPLGETPT